MTKKSFIDLVHDFAEARHKHGAAEYNAVTRAALDALLADVEALRKDKERAERNRDMWKGQCERQALQLGHIHETLYSIERSTELRNAHALADAALTGRPWTQAGGPIDAALGAVAREGEQDAS